ncbi:MAG TPA: DUF1015 family protein, partial [Nitrospiraceae bacterium]|nr:DUF1015 family protein [Nitrospiraceae bacterium]
METAPRRKQGPTHHTVAVHTGCNTTIAAFLEFNGSRVRENGARLLRMTERDESEERDRPHEVGTQSALACLTRDAFRIMEVEGGGIQNSPAGTLNHLRSKGFSMAKIIPFHGTAYDTSIIGDVTQVVAPPYDIIDAAGQRALHDRHPQNIIRLELGLDCENGGGCMAPRTRRRTACGFSPSGTAHSLPARFLST